MVAGKVLVAGLALAVLSLAGSAPVIAQSCNGDISVQNIPFRLNPGGLPQKLIWTIKNNNPPGGNITSFDKIFYRPNCKDVDSSQAPQNEQACGTGGSVMYDDGLPAGFGGRPFATPGSFLLPGETTCLGVAVTEFYNTPNPNNITPGVEWLEFTFPGNPTTPGFLKLAPGQSCVVAFQLQVGNFPERFDDNLPLPPTQEQASVDQITGVNVACLKSDNPSLPFDILSQAADSTAAEFSRPVCDAEVDKQVSCDGGATWNDVDPDLSDGQADGVAAGCTGWDDPNAPFEVKVRYLARNNSLGNFTNANNNTLTACQLSDSNLAVLAAPVAVGDLPGINDPGFMPNGVVLLETPLLECSSQLAANEPDTAILDCLCPAQLNPQDPDLPPITPPIQRTDEANIDCEQPAVELTKECVGEEPAGTFNYTLQVANPPNPTGATIANCEVTDPGTTCHGLMFAGPFLPGTASAAVPCTGPTASNTAQVSCDVLDANGLPVPKPVTDEDSCASCVIEIDKQVSCDGGANWNDVTGGDDVDGEGIFGCTGWTPESGPPEVKVRYLADSTLDAFCVLTDTNTAILPGPQQIDITAGQQAMFMTDLIACDESQSGWLEPDTATLSCECFDPTGQPVGEPQPVEDTANIDCETPGLEVVKECAVEQRRRHLQLRREGDEHGDGGPGELRADRHEPGACGLRHGSEPDDAGSDRDGDGDVHERIRHEHGEGGLRHRGCLPAGRHAEDGDVGVDGRLRDDRQAGQLRRWVHVARRGVQRPGEPGVHGLASVVGSERSADP